MVIRLKYLLITFSILSPYLLIKNARRKKRADLLIVDPSKNKGNEILKAPALIVKTLNGIGVKQYAEPHATSWRNSNDRK